MSTVMQWADGSTPLSPCLLDQRTCLLSLPSSVSQYVAAAFCTAINVAMITGMHRSSVIQLAYQSSP